LTFIKENKKKNLPKIREEGAIYGEYRLEGARKHYGERGRTRRHAKSTKIPKKNGNGKLAFWGGGGSKTVSLERGEKSLSSSNDTAAANKSKEQPNCSSS